MMRRVIAEVQLLIADDDEDVSYAGSRYTTLYRVGVKDLYEGLVSSAQLYVTYMIGRWVGRIGVGRWGGGEVWRWGGGEMGRWGRCMGRWGAVGLGVWVGGWVWQVRARMRHVKRQDVARTNSCWRATHSVLGTPLPWGCEVMGRGLSAVGCDQRACG